MGMAPFTLVISSILYQDKIQIRFHKLSSRLRHMHLFQPDNKSEFSPGKCEHSLMRLLFDCMHLNRFFLSYNRENDSKFQFNFNLISVQLQLPLSHWTDPVEAIFTDCLVTHWRSKDHICVLERQMHSHLFDIWLEQQSEQFDFNPSQMLLGCIYTFRQIFRYISNPSKTHEA